MLVAKVVAEQILTAPKVNESVKAYNCSLFARDRGPTVVVVPRGSSLSCSKIKQQQTNKAEIEFTVVQRTYGSMRATRTTYRVATMLYVLVVMVRL